MSARMKYLRIPITQNDLFSFYSMGGFALSFQVSFFFIHKQNTYLKFKPKYCGRNLQHLFQKNTLHCFLYSSRMDASTRSSQGTHTHGAQVTGVQPSVPWVPLGGGEGLRFPAQDVHSVCRAGPLADTTSDKATSPLTWWS